MQVRYHSEVRNQGVSAPNRLLTRALDPHPTERIGALCEIAKAAQTWGDAQRSQAIGNLLDLLADTASDDYEYGRFQCDDEEPAVRVCDVAAQALVQLGYARTLKQAVARARSEGHAIAMRLPRRYPK